MGALAHGRWWLPARRERARGAPRPRSSASASPTRRPPGSASCRAASARACCSPGRSCRTRRPAARRAARRGRPRQRRKHRGVFASLRDEGRALLVSTHDVDSAREFDRVLCLNRRQVAYGTPAEVLNRPTLEATYGDEIVVIEEERRPGAPSASSTTSTPSTRWTSSTSSSTPGAPASTGARCSRSRCSARSAAGWASGSYERLSYAAESLAHGMLPGLVLAALAGAPLLLGGVGGVAVAAVVVALASRDERIGADTATAVVVTGASASARCSRWRQTPARLGELLFGDPLGVTDGDLLAAAMLARGRRRRPRRPPPPARCGGVRRGRRAGASACARGSCGWRCAPARRSAGRRSAGSRQPAGAGRAGGAGRRGPPPRPHAGRAIRAGAVSPCSPGSSASRLAATRQRRRRLGGAVLVRGGGGRSRPPVCGARSPTGGAATAVASRALPLARRGERPEYHATRGYLRTFGRGTAPMDRPQRYAVAASLRAQCGEHRRAGGHHREADQLRRA